MSAAVKNEDIPEVKLLITLKSMKSFNSFESNIFYVRGNSWMIKLNKLNNCIYVNSMSKIEIESNDWAIVAAMSARLIPSNIHIDPAKKQFLPIAFYQGNMMEKVSAFSSCTFDSKCGSGTCQMEIKVKTTPLLLSTQHEWLQFKSIPKCCPNNLDVKFHMTVKLINDFIGVCSPEIIWKNCKFRISVVRIGDNIQMNLFKLDHNTPWPEPQTVSWKLIPFNSNNQPLQCQLKNLSKSYHCLGAIKWDDLVKPSNRYIKNNLFVVEFVFEGETLKRQTCADGGDKLTCMICFGRLNNLSASVLECGHIFCTVCIETAIQQRKCCPKCNHSATESQLRKIYLPFE